ncbi:MAG: hypothetical protein DRJ64_01555 [Thermoprotei archaeon]|nr:MAG: hypothetical protein DRJ64_01555 [Thermoprotei archaeon]
MSRMSKRMNMIVGENDWIILYFSEKRRYIYQVSDKEISLNEGIVNLGNLIGKEYGGVFKTHLGVPFRVVKASLLDVILEKFKRKTQIIYPKDLGCIIIAANIKPGSRVIEAGTGSGVLTAIIANYIQPSGRVFTYEIRREFYETAIRNLRRIALDKFVEFKLEDIKEAKLEKNVDSVVLDLPDPWNVLQNVSEALRSGGKIVCFVPTINQAEKTHLTLKENGFIFVETKEVLERKYEVKKGATRPYTLMRGHTGYIVSATKI